MSVTSVACGGVDSAVRLALAVHDADSTVTKVSRLAASTAGSTGTGGKALAIFTRVAAERAIDAPDSAVVRIVEAGSVAGDTAQGQARRLAAGLAGTVAGPRDYVANERAGVRPVRGSVGNTAGRHVRVH